MAGTLPGEFVAAEFFGKRKRLQLGRLRQVKTPSEHRVTPPCVHFGYCGGCRWQHIDYQQQLMMKREKVFGLLQQYPTVTQEIPCPHPWRYRNKMEYNFSQNAARDRFLGLSIDGSKYVFNIEECHIVAPWFVNVVKGVRNWWSESGLEAWLKQYTPGSLKTLTLRHGLKYDDRMVILGILGGELLPAHREAFLGCVKEAAGKDLQGSLSIWCATYYVCRGERSRIAYELLQGPGYLTEELVVGCPGKEVSLKFRVGPASFFQPNPAQAERLYSLAINLADIGPDTVVYDLYCGTGTLALVAASFAKEVLGVERCEEAVLLARDNAVLNGIRNVSFVCGDVGRVLAGLERTSPDVVLLDPPRSGLDPKAINAVLTLKPKIIVYISCNVETQADNVAALVEGGYRVEARAFVDQFPHTIHTESVVKLVR